MVCKTHTWCNAAEKLISFSVDRHTAFSYTYWYIGTETINCPVIYNAEKMFSLQEKQEKDALAAFFLK